MTNRHGAGHQAFLAVLILSPLAILGLAPGTLAQGMRNGPLSMRAPVSDQLIVHPRAGLQASVRQQVLAGQAAHEVGRIPALGAVLVRVPHRQSYAVARALRRSGYFKAVEPDQRAVAAEVPNDPSFPSQWGLSKIGAPAAWDVTQGSDEIVVAVVDSGVDASHPDLRGQLLPGYDFVNNDWDPADDNGHGTRMAGIIAAQASNGIGIVGVAPHSKVIPVKVLGADATGPYSAIANGITYAADRGARVINLSLAGSSSSVTLQSAVDYAAARWVVVVAAAGNSGTGDPMYPAAYTNAVAVSATDSGDAVATFSNYGAWLRLAAPGVGVLTTNWNASGGDPLYAASNGTSPAAAMTSGAFALLFSARPELPTSNAIAQLTQTARDIGSTGWDPFSGWGRVDVAAALGVQPQAPTPPPTPVATPAQDRKPPIVSIVSPVSGSLAYGLQGVDVAAVDNIGVTRVELMVDGMFIAADNASPFGFVWDTTTVAPGWHTLSATAYDAAGNRRLSKKVRVSVTSGVGLLITRLRLSPSKFGSQTDGVLRVQGMFVLPDGAALDETANSIAVRLASNRGTVLATASESAGFAADARGRLQLTLPAGQGVMNVRIARSKTQSTYNLAITAAPVSLANADLLMSLALTINGTTLSQSAVCHQLKSSFIFP